MVVRNYSKCELFSIQNGEVCYYLFFQVLLVNHNCSSTQACDSVLPSIVGTRDQILHRYPLLFFIRNLGPFCASGTEHICTPMALRVLWTTPGVRCIQIPQYP